METPLVATASKWIGTNGKALWPGDLINNHGNFNVLPKYDEEFFKLLHINAEKFNSISSSYHAMYKDQRIMVCAMSGGFAAWRTGGHFLPKVLEHSERLSGDEADEPFFTVQRLGDVLDSEVMASDIYSQNVRNNKTAVMIAAQAACDAFIVGPAQREGFSRTINKIFSLLRGAKYEDVIFEKHFWGPTILLDMSHLIQHGDGSWSRNGSLERGIAVAVQYGSPRPLTARRMRTMDVVDVYGRPVSVVDQAWEDSRHLVYELTRTYTYEGKTYKARSETAAALMLSRLMHDHLFRTGVPLNKGGLDRAHAHPSVLAHYASVYKIEDPKKRAEVERYLREEIKFSGTLEEYSAQQMKRFDELKGIMVPFLAAYSNVPTFHKILANDPALKKFWEQHVLPSQPKLRLEAEIKDTVLSYLPRGGFEVGELNAFVKRRADPAAPRGSFNQSDRPAVVKNTLAYGFDSEFDPEIYFDPVFNMLGNTRHPRHKPDNDHLVFEQGAAIMSLAGLGDGVVPLNCPKTYLYLDDPAGGVAAPAFMQRHGMTDPTQLGAAFDIHTSATASFGEAVVREVSSDLVDRQREIGLNHAYQDYLKSKKIGNILSLSDFRASLNYTGMREATKTPAHKALAPDGSMFLGKETLEAVARRATTLYMEGIIIPAGMLTPLQARVIGEALIVAIGKVKRGGNNMDYKMEFLMDYDYRKPPGERDPKNLKKLDLADLIIHLGLQVKGLLEQPKPPKCPDLYITMARLLDIYERLFDPGRRNTKVERGAHDGKDSKETIIDIDAIDDPEFKEFIGFRSAVPSYEDTPFDTPNAVHDAFFARPDYQAFAQPERKKPKGFYQKLIYDRDGNVDMVGKAELAHNIWAWMRSASIPSPSGKPGQNWVVSGNLLARGIQYFDESSLTDLPEQYRSAKTAWGNLNATQRAHIFRQNTLSVESPSVSR